MLSHGPSGFFSLSPSKMQFVLYLNMSYTNMALTAAHSEAFLTDLRDVVALAFQVGLGRSDRARGGLYSDLRDVVALAFQVGLGCRKCSQGGL